MKLFTDKQRTQLIQNGLAENRDKDHRPVVKLFLPGSACTWLISEIDNEESDFLFGLCDLGMGFPELGSVSLRELQALRSPLKLSVERDISFEGNYPLSVYAEAARVNGYITEDETQLQRAMANYQSRQPKLLNFKPARNLRAGLFSGFFILSCYHWSHL